MVMFYFSPAILSTVESTGISYGMVGFIAENKT